MGADRDESDAMRRLVNAGIRLHGLATESEIVACIVDETTALLDARRVLVVLQQGDALRMAASHVPAGETADALFRAIAPWLAEARKRRKAGLRRGPEDAAPVDQRSCLVAPMLAGDALLGYLYCDIDGRFGRYAKPECDLLAMLAAQAGAALAHAIEKARLLDEKQRLLKETEQRNAELAVINAIQHGLAGSLDFEAIVDRVGDKLRDVFKTGNLGIRWHDAGTVSYLYEYQRGVRIFPEPHAIRPDSPVARTLEQREVFLVNTRAESEAMGLRMIPGTDAGRSIVVVPIVTSDRLLGGIAMEDYDRDHAFGPNDVRLLQTVASSMGVAMENVRLFNETQEALARQTASADILRVISSSPTDVQPVFEAIVTTALRLLSCARTAVLRCDEQRFYTTVQADATGIMPRVELGAPIDPAANFPSRVIVDRAPLHLPDWSAIELTAHERHIQEVMGTHASLMLPLLRGDTCIGVLAFMRKEAVAFTTTEIALAQSFADQAMIAIENVRLFNETEDRARTADRGPAKSCAPSPMRKPMRTRSSKPSRAAP